MPASSHTSHLRKTVKKYRYTHSDEDPTDDAAAEALRVAIVDTKKDIFNFAFVTVSDREACVEACVSFSTPRLSAPRFTLSSSVEPPRVVDKSPVDS